MKYIRFFGYRCMSRRDKCTITIVYDLPLN